jgi:hypothetical protein
MTYRRGPLIGADTKNGIQVVRKSVTFDGTPGGGAIGTVPVFLITGLVMVRDCAIWWDGPFTYLTPPMARLDLGTPTSPNSLIDLEDADWFQLGFQWADGKGLSFFTRDYVVQGPHGPNGPLSEDVVFNVTDNDILSGSGTVYLWYEPISSNGRLIPA